MTLWNRDDLSKALGVKLDNDVSIEKVVIDSREVRPRTLFVGLVGENHNGGDFAESALRTGAELVIVDRNAKAIKSDKVIVVVDTLEALNKLANYSRARTKAKVIGVTGSVGKTTTKEMLRVVCESIGKTYASVGNFNNHFGLPLCLANLPQETDYAILEMGMSAKGEILRLTKIAKPDMAIINTVEAVHLEYFKDVSEIAQAKSEIFEGVAKNGFAIINFDNPYRKIMEAEANNKGLKICGFGKSNDTDARLLSYEIKNEKGFAKIELEGKAYNIAFDLVGEHYALNALAVLLAVKKLTNKVPYEPLQTFQAQGGRGRVFEINGIRIIDDAYNASPASVNAALKGMKQRVADRKIVVLGDMRELGAQSKKMHEGLLDNIIEAGIVKVFLVGDLMHNLWDKLPTNLRGVWTKEYTEMLPKVKSELKQGDLALFKGSNSMKIHEIVRHLEK